MDQALAQLGQMFGKRLFLKIIHTTPETISFLRAPLEEQPNILRQTQGQTCRTTIIPFLTKNDAFAGGAFTLPFPLPRSAHP